MAPGSRSMTACRPAADVRKAPRGRRAAKAAAAALSWFFTLSTLGLPVRATAQSAVNLHAGFSMATLGGRDVSELRPEHRVGTTVALSITPLSFDGYYWLTVAYAEKGARLEARSTNLNLGYIELSGLARVDLFSESTIFAGSPFGPYLLVGTTVGFEVRCRTSPAFRERDEPLGCDESTSDGKIVDYGFAGGLGVGYDVSTSTTLSLGVLYSPAMSLRSRIAMSNLAASCRTTAGSQAACTYRRSA